MSAVHGRRATRAAGTVLRKEDLHGSTADPVLDTMTFLNEITIRYPDAISFAAGRPFAGFFDIEAVFAGVRRYLRYAAEHGTAPEDLHSLVYQYGPTAGTIREVIAASLAADEDIHVAPESIVVTVGCQEAMLMALRTLFADRNDVLLVSSPCYVGITGAARLLDIPVRPVEEREDGLSAVDLARAIDAERAEGRRPRACYVIPDHANPSGSTMSLQARHALLEAAARHGILLLEDSPYRLVSAGERMPTLKSLDRTRQVVHLGSYAKTLFPGARVGFVIADQLVRDADGTTTLLALELGKVKSMVTVNTSSLSQAAVAGMLLDADGMLSTANAEATARYDRCRRTMLGRLDDLMPPARAQALEVSWNRPKGGFFLAMRVPFRTDNAALERSAERHGVIWTPMSYFHPCGGGEFTMRLAFSNLTTAQIEEGVRRLVEFFAAEREAGGDPADHAVPAPATVAG